MNLKQSSKMRTKIFINPRSSTPTASLFKFAAFLILILISASDAHSQTPYDDIKESDLRTEEIRKKLIQNEGLPESFRLRYSEPLGNYLYFYDRENISILFKYREDRFDRDAEKKISHLIPGQPYTVKGNFLGVILDARFYPSSHPDFKKFISNVNSQLVFEFANASPIKTEQILIGKGEVFNHLNFPFQFTIPVKSMAEIKPDGESMMAEIYSRDSEIYLVTLSSFNAKDFFKIPAFLDCSDETVINKQGEINCGRSKKDHISRSLRYIKSKNKIHFFSLSIHENNPDETSIILNSLKTVE